MVGDDHATLAGRRSLLAIECCARTFSPVAFSHWAALVRAELLHFRWWIVLSPCSRATCTALRIQRSAVDVPPAPLTPRQIGHPPPVREYSRHHSQRNL